MFEELYFIPGKEDSGRVAAGTESSYEFTRLEEGA
jgi:hypothetical protein